MENIDQEGLLSDVLAFMESVGVSETKIKTLGWNNEARETISDFVELITENLPRLRGPYVETPLQPTAGDKGENHGGR